MAIVFSVKPWYKKGGYAEPDTWVKKTWNGLSDFNGSEVWTDGTNIYAYQSSSSQHYQLNKATSTWSTIHWSTPQSKIGTISNIWTDGDDIYFSSGSTQYVLDKTSSFKWIQKTWDGMSSFDGQFIWTDGNDIYYSYGSTEKKLNKKTSRWSDKTWNGLSSAWYLFGYNIWRTSNNIYESNSSDSGNYNHILNSSNSTWSNKTWNNISSFYGYNVWTDGTKIFMSSGWGTNKILDEDSSTWSNKIWNIPYSTSSNKNISGSNVWTDGINIYNSVGSIQYILVRNPSPIATTKTLTTCKPKLLI